MSEEEQENIDKDKKKPKKKKKKKVLKKSLTIPIVKKKKRRKKYKKRKPKNKVDLRKQLTRYRIIITSHNKILTEVFKSNDRDKTLESFDKIIEGNKERVKFPIKFCSKNHLLMEAKYELLLMKSVKENETDLTTGSLLRNEYGKFVPHLGNSEKLIIIRKEPFLIEESFWVYGYNPKSQRKDYNFILNELLLKGLFKTKFPLKRMIVYKNKLIIDGMEDFHIVICKNEDDSARLYTELENELSNLKYKCVFLAGIAMGGYEKNIEEKIIDKTGWDIRKIRRKSTRP